MIKLVNNGLTRHDRAVSVVENQMKALDSYCEEIFRDHRDSFIRAAEEVLEELEKTKDGTCH